MSFVGLNDFVDLKNQENHIMEAFS